MKSRRGEVIQPRPVFDAVEAWDGLHEERDLLRRSAEI